MSPTKRIPWCDYCNRIMYQFLATHRPCPRNCGRDIGTLARLMDCTHPGFEEAVWPKIKSSLRQKLFELHRDGNIVIYVSDDGVEQAYWPPGTDCWREDTWDGRRDCRVDPSIRERLEAHGTLEGVERGRSRRGAYVFARDPERRRDDSPSSATRGSSPQPPSELSDDGSSPPSAVSSGGSTSASTAGDTDEQPLSLLSDDVSRLPSELSDDGAEAYEDSVMSDDLFSPHAALYSALSGPATRDSWARSYSDEQVSNPGGSLHGSLLTTSTAQADGPLSGAREGASEEAAAGAQEAREVGMARFGREVKSARSGGEGRCYFRYVQWVTVFLFFSSGSLGHMSSSKDTHNHGPRRQAMGRLGAIEWLVFLRQVRLSGMHTEKRLHITSAF